MFCIAIGNVCALFAEDSKGKALNGADFVCGVANPDKMDIYCRADAVKDERSEVNHISGNVCALFAEDPKGKTQQSEATVPIPPHQ